jgi:hypothetical protein
MGLVIFLPFDQGNKARRIVSNFITHEFRDYGAAVPAARAIG